MNSIEILNTVNTVSISTSNFRFCYTVPFLTELYQSVRADLESIRFSISPELYSMLDNALRDAHWEQLCKLKGYQA